MGIPSYYKKLLAVLPGLVSKQCHVVDWLFMDFNCLIYHCLHHAPPYTGEKEEWEQLFLECIVVYTKKVIKQVNPKKGIYIAIDGVVPMAKMKQQRLRRFKSAWLAKQEHDVKKWDTNAITPGTNFMAQLKARLLKMIAESLRKMILSSSDEPGEGEHKIIAAWRTNQYQGNYAIYGLDADLIVLALLGQETCSLKNQMWLFREEVVAGAMTRDEQGEEIFEWFSIDLLKTWLMEQLHPCRETGVTHVGDARGAGGMENARGAGGMENARGVGGVGGVRGVGTGNAIASPLLNYCFAMSILGNDFLPGSLGLKIRDDGHTELLRILSCLTVPLIDTSLTISMEGVTELVKQLSLTESVRICTALSKKQMFSNQLKGETVKVGDPYSAKQKSIGGGLCQPPDNNWPLTQMEEGFLLESGGHKKQLVSNWKELYLSRFFSSKKETICREYLCGMNWIWQYYTGQPVCFNWYYPFALPPLWEWLQHSTVLPSISINLRATDIKPIEQLAIVLPLDSWHLLPDCDEKRFPLYAPHFFPASFSFESVGKRFFWECESLIPLPTPMELKSIILHTKVAQLQ